MSGNPAELSRFRRLSHHQWQNTVQDLLLQDQLPPLSEDFRGDPTQGGYLFEGAADALEIDPSLWQSYQSAAIKLAKLFTADEENIAPFLPSDPTELNSNEKAKEFIQRFGLRAYRRPVDDKTKDAYFRLYQSGRDAYTDQSGFLAGIRLVVEAFLQAPSFLYRTELSADAIDGRVPLTKWERASRLSYFLWGTMPDAKLRKAAADGILDTEEGLREQADRLINDKRAADIFENFFERVLEVERYEAIAPSADAFPEAPRELADLARAETQHFLREVMHERGGSLRDLLTSTTTYVNADLARLYGLEGEFDEDFEEVELDPTERSGVLTQIGFLASHATSRDPDPIHRGVFLARRISCLTIAAPPDDIPPLPTPDPAQTNRQRVEAHTEAEGTTCRTCHSSIINPFGFAFEGYDALGAYRTMDGESPVDTNVTALVGADLVPFSGALEMTQALAQSTDIHQCFSGHLLSFAYGRNLMVEDEALKLRLGAESLEGALPFSKLMVEVAVAMALRDRTALLDETTALDDTNSLMPEEVSR